MRRHREPRRDALANVRAAVRMHDEGRFYSEIGEALHISKVAAWKLVKRWTEWVHARRISGVPAE